MFRMLSRPFVAVSSAVPLAFALLLALPTSTRGQQAVGKDKVFLRITNLRSDQSKILIRINPVPNHACCSAPMPTLGLMIPTRPDLTGRVYTLEEALRAQLEEMPNMPDSDGAAT